MFAVSADMKKINGREVETFSREVSDAATELIVEAGATGLEGVHCPRERSARAYLALDCVCGDFLFSPILDGEKRAVGIEIAACGDEALLALIRSLDFALKALSDPCQ